MKKVYLFLLLTLSVQLFSQAQQSSSSYDSKFFDKLKWRNVGPPRGGRSLGASGSPGRTNEYYFGATGGGLWKTTDGGTEWAPVTDGQITCSSIGAVAVAETNPDVVSLEGEKRS